MESTKLKEILESHKLWLSGQGGKRAKLSRANLSVADLSNAELSGAKLSRVNLYRANLSTADLSGANLSNADLSGANLYRANLSGAGLSGTKFSYISNLGGYFVSVDPCGIRIGCEYHPASQWKKFSKDAISKMARNAVGWWSKYNKTVFALYDAVVTK